MILDSRKHVGNHVYVMVVGSVSCDGCGVYRALWPRRLSGAMAFRVFVKADGRQVYQAFFSPGEAQVVVPRATRRYGGSLLVTASY